MPADADLDLRPERRDAVAQEVIEALDAAVAGSRCELRGSLADGTADALSDVDVRWVVPAEALPGAVAAASAALARVGPLLLVREDPDLAGSPRGRALFAQFEDLPVFWPVDVEVLAEPDPGPDGASGRRGEPWSRPGGALATAIAVLKAVQRGRPDAEAAALLERGYGAIGATWPDIGWRHGVAGLARLAAAHDPDLAPLAERVETLAAALRAE